MNSHVIKEYFFKALSFGSDDKTSNSQLKKVKLFNAFCYTWYMIAFLLTMTHYLDFGKIDAVIIAHYSFCAVIAIAQILHAKTFYTIAHFLFVCCLFATVFIFSNFVSPGELTEFYYLMLAPIALIFISNRFLNYIILLAALLGFIIPNKLYGYYEDGLGFDSLIQPFLLVSIFIIVNYFKTLNEKNEAFLEINRNELERINQYQSQFFINISHEIRTPLTLIKGQIEALRAYQSSQPGLKIIEKNLNHQVNEIKQMVDDVLDSSKMKSANFELQIQPINISDLINQIYVDFMPNFEAKSITLTLIKPSEDYTINADKQYLKRAISNIVLNALKYTDKNGSVTIELLKLDNELKLSVQDTGIGISNKDLKKIAQQFYQVDNDINRAGGSGIGLSFAKDIVERHNAKLQISSKLGKGSTFEIVFTNADLVIENHNSVTDSINELPITAEGTESEMKNDQCILIVDDHMAMRQHLKTVLKNYHFLEAENGLEALKHLQKNKVDLIVTDYMMPKMNGPEFVKTLKANNYWMPVLMLTARSDKESRVRSFRLGIDDYMNKPFDRDELLIRIENIIKNNTKRLNFIRSEKIQQDEVNMTYSWIKKVET